MNFLELAKKRYSVRNYLNKPVEKEKLDLILEAGRVSPTAGNNQPQKIFVIKTEDGLSKLKKAANIYNAPIALLVCSNSDTVWTRPQDNKKMTDIDSSIVSTHMMLQAADSELGSLYITWFDPEIIRLEFNLPENIIPVNILLIGYSADKNSNPERHDSKRKKLDEFIINI